MGAKEAAEGTRYVLVVRLPREVEVRIEDAYLSLAGLTKPVMGYHITLLGSFFLPEGADPLKLSGVLEACRRHRPFVVRVSGLDSFPSADDNVVFLCIVNPEELIALHNDLLEATRSQVLAQDERSLKWNVEAFRPHVTLGIGLNDRQLARLLAAGVERRVDALFEVAHIWLVEQVRNGPWEYIAGYPLGSVEQDQGGALITERLSGDRGAE